jgi:alpha-ketoglutarate-dependent taurine dioxygenase
MIEHKLHANGWTAFVDIDLKKCTQQDVNDIAKLIASNTCVVFKNQSLTIDDELKFLNMFKDPTPMVGPNDPMFKDWVSDIEKDPTGVLCRVTAEERDGAVGMAFWHDEFDWHCNDPETPNRCPIVYLHGIKGTTGSRTSWNNNILAYHDLDDGIKTRVANLHSIYGNISATHAYEHSGVKYNTEWTPPFVQQTMTGQTGMYYSPLQFGKFLELSQHKSDELKNLLHTHVLNEKYLYHHDWQDGDIVISDQWNGVHKRWPFDHMDQRVLHRGMCYYPDQVYTS